jgi:hypothetical protein
LVQIQFSPSWFFDIASQIGLFSCAPGKTAFLLGVFACRGFLDFALLGFLPWYDRGFLPVRFEFINRNAALSLPPAARHCLPSSLSVPVLPKKGIYLGFSCATVSSAEIINDFSILFVRIEFFSLSNLGFLPFDFILEVFPLVWASHCTLCFGASPYSPLMFFSPLIYGEMWKSVINPFVGFEQT